jgi:hypothetical protein
MDTLTITAIVTPDRTTDVTELADQVLTDWLQKAGAPPEIAALIEESKYAHGIMMAPDDMFPADLLPRQREIELAGCMSRLWGLISDLVGREAQLTPANG